MDFKVTLKIRGANSSEVDSQIGLAENDSCRVGTPSCDFS